MDGALVRGAGEKRAPAVQAGKQLCVSETIFPRGSRHSFNLVYRGIGTGGRPGPPLDVRMSGGEFVDLRDMGPAPWPPTDAVAHHPGFRGGRGTREPGEVGKV